MIKKLTFTVVCAALPIVGAHGAQELSAQQVKQERRRSHSSHGSRPEYPDGRRGAVTILQRFGGAAADERQPAGQRTGRMRLPWNTSIGIRCVRKTWLSSSNSVGS